MDKLPIELLESIVEYACTGDGKAARRVCLVSKFFRSLAGPIELRSIAVSGFKQLKGAISRLERVNATSAEGDWGRKRVEVRYLLISELAAEHAITEERCAVFGASFWMKEGIRLAKIYPNEANEFWEAAGYLVRSTSTTLRSLSLLTSDHWMEMVLTPGWETSSKILGALSGASFPRLVSLTVVHNARFDSMVLGDRFQNPVFPSLRRLRVLSPVLMPSPIYVTAKYHPLLLNFRDTSPELIHLSLTGSDLSRERIGDIIFGEGRVKSPTRLELPGKLRCVTVLPHPIERELSSRLRELNINGLEVRENYPEGGQTWYEALSTDWEAESCGYLT